MFIHVTTLRVPISVNSGYGVDVADTRKHADGLKRLVLLFQWCVANNSKCMYSCNGNAPQL